jgi:hypothetical protein
MMWITEPIVISLGEMVARRISRSVSQAGVAGHEHRHEPLNDYCKGLLLQGLAISGRKRIPLKDVIKEKSRPVDESPGSFIPIRSAGPRATTRLRRSGHSMRVGDASIVVMQAGAIDRARCAAAALSNNRIPLSEVPPGSHLCVHTNENRYAGVVITAIRTVQSSTRGRLTEVAMNVTTVDGFPSRLAEMVAGACVRVDVDPTHPAEPFPASFGL